MRATETDACRQTQRDTHYTETPSTVAQKSLRSLHNVVLIWSHSAGRSRSTIADSDGTDAQTVGVGTEEGVRKGERVVGGRADH